MTVTSLRTSWMLLVMLGLQGALGEESHLLAQSRASTASVRGRVVAYEEATLLEGALVSLTLDGEAGGAGQETISGPDGTFLFPVVSPGRYRLSVTMLGYTDRQDTLQVVADSDMEVTLPLSVSAVRLSPIVVAVPRRASGPLVDFDRRRQTLNGTFFDREDIESANAQEFTDILRTVPGVRLAPEGNFGNRVYLRGCEPDLWLDGTQIGNREEIDAFLRPEDLEAIEVYRGPELPGEFGSTLCGAIVAWTRRGALAGSAAQEKSLKQQFLVAGSVALIFLGFHFIR